MNINYRTWQTRCRGSYEAWICANRLYVNHVKTRVNSTTQENGVLWNVKISASVHAFSSVLAGRSRASFVNREWLKSYVFKYAGATYGTLARTACGPPSGCFIIALSSLSVACGPLERLGGGSGACWWRISVPRMQLRRILVKEFGPSEAAPAHAGEGFR